jgi:hypothetical protein
MHGAVDPDYFYFPDTPLRSVLAHRFYYRQGLFATAFRFMRTIE